ncbi:MAG: hemolysin [Euryarchaeota archaeon]|jgi:CBS domain containing-hemolysin-like protein|nr:hemolysin [Euryarchaeota archaeon]MBD19152.1 hemolysin [Euryarchaeota archaeon]|tara:strand:+ start:1272 stop:2405 length:1134 start_codon:yes stop_codon:yes gene_type:complete
MRSESEVDVHTLVGQTSVAGGQGDYTLLILYATLALGASFLCSVLEAVLLSTSISHVKVLEQKGSRVANLWARFKDEPERPLTAILTLNTIAHTVGALGVGAEVAAMVEGTESEALVMAVASSVLTLGILVLSEIIPKTLGALYWKNLSVFSAYTLRGLILILLPIVIPMEWMRNLFPAKSESAVTRDELAAMVEVAEDESVIETDEEKAIRNLLSLRDQNVTTVMTPRTVMSFVLVDDTVQAAMDKNPIMVHGRLPVFDGEIDQPVGLVLRSDIYRKAAADEHQSKMSSLMRDIVRVGEKTNLDDLLDIFLSRKEQLALVQDEFGATLGLVTMEDVIETILGVEIVDEKDIEGIEEGVTGEDLRKFAIERRQEESE